jgi:hypothetical protein
MTHDVTLSGLIGVDLGPLEQRLRGTLLRPGMPAYDSARQLMNRAVTRRPAAIAQAADAQDVVEIVRFARDHGLPLGVRSGGHSPAGYGMVDDALVVDLSSMKRVTLDPEARLARVEPGVTSGELAALAQAHGLALSTGDTSSVGFGGLATGGGIGFMVRKYGLTIDNLVAAQVVTAAGKVVTASATEHPDLFWAIRGGGGNFGIVTEFTVRLAEVGQILGGDLVLPASREVIRGYLDYVADAPDELTTIAQVMHAPPAPYIPEAHVGELVLSVLVTWAGSESEGQRALAPLRALAEPVADAVGLMPYPAIFDFTAHQAVPICHTIRTVFTREVSDAVVDIALDAVEHASSPFSMVQFRGLGGAMARVEAEATASLIATRATWSRRWHSGWMRARMRRRIGPGWMRYGRRSAQGVLGHTSTSWRTRGPTECARPTRYRHWPGWRRSSASTIRITCSGSTRTLLRLCAPERLETVKPSHAARGGRLIRPPLESLKTRVVPLGRAALELVRQQDRLGHLAHRLAVVHADPAHALEGFRLAQAVHLHQDALGALDQLARL